MYQRTFFIIAWIAVIWLAVWLRVDELEARPIHADEATGAHIFSQRIENANYRFDPTHFHGPLLSLSTLPLAKLYGESSWQELSLPMLRTGPVLAGLLMVLSPLLWLRMIGPRAALGAAALLACSPLLVYYNRMYIHESWLVLFGMLAVAAIFYVVKQPTRNRAILAGLATGLMFATKETFAISMIAWTVAGAACWLMMLAGKAGTDHRPPTFIDYLKPAGWFAGTVLAVGTVFYTNVFRDPVGIVDAIRTYFVYETTPGHDKPFFYYFETLIWPKHTLGMWWTEGGIVLLGLVACVLAVMQKTRRLAISFIAIGFLTHLLIYSLISYKNPWLMMLPWALACLLAGCAFTPRATSESKAKLVVLTTCLGLILLFQTRQATHASGRLANHDNNPYAYVPTSRNIAQLPAWLRELEPYQGDQTIEPIAVIGREYWPLPWYLRDFEQVGYWVEPPEDVVSRGVVISMPAEREAVEELLADTHIQLPRTLRSNVPITLFLRNEIWNAWTEPTDE